MEQGVSPLISLLIDDLVEEHREQEGAVAELVAHADDLVTRPDWGPVAMTLRAGIDALVWDLEASIRLEDDVLFARFDGAPCQGPAMWRGPRVAFSRAEGVIPGRCEGCTSQCGSAS